MNDIHFLNPPISTPTNELLQRAQLACDLLDKRDQNSFHAQGGRWLAWMEMHERMFRAISPEGLLSFQANPDIAPQITGGSGSHFIHDIARLYGNDTLSLLLAHYRETLCGSPGDLTTHDGTYITVTAMRHLYHMAQVRRFSRDMPGFGQGAPAFVEIGGGYGNQARMFLQYGLAQKYFIIDHPVMHALQFFYLGDFLPLKDIAILDGEHGYLHGDENSRVTLLSMYDYKQLVQAIPQNYGLVTTMALTEISTQGQQEYLETLSPAFVYVFGQLENQCLVGCSEAADLGFSNTGLREELAKRWHTLSSSWRGYHFEFIGRKI